MIKYLLIASFLLISIIGPTSAQTTFGAGDTVLAYWEGNNLYFVGTVVEKSAANGTYKIIFADGDQAVLASNLVRKMDIAVGSKVMAMWSDKKYYPGTVAKIVGGALFINYDDGDKGWTSWAGVAVP